MLAINLSDMVLLKTTVFLIEGKNNHCSRSTQIHKRCTAALGEILNSHFLRLLLRVLNSCGIKLVRLKVVCLGKPPRTEEKSSSLHSPKGMQESCKTHCFSPPFILPYFNSFSVLPSCRPVQGIQFHPLFDKAPLSSYLLLASRGNPLGPEHLQGVSSHSHSHWERNSHLLNLWGYVLLVAFLLPPPLCLSYLFILIRPPRLAERTLDIYLSLTLLM